MRQCVSGIKSFRTTADTQPTLTFFAYKLPYFCPSVLVVQFYSSHYSQVHCDWLNRKPLYVFRFRYFNIFHSLLMLYSYWLFAFSEIKRHMPQNAFLWIWFQPHYCILTHRNEHYGGQATHPHTYTHTRALSAALWQHSIALNG